MHPLTNSVSLILVLGLSVLGHDVNASAEDFQPETIQIDVSKFEPVGEKRRQTIQGWLIDLESTPLLADQLAVVTTGEYFVGGRTGGREIVDAKQFAFCWATKEGAQQQRVLFQDEGLINPIVQDSARGAYIQSSASQFDQLKRDNRYFEADGRQLLPESDKPQLDRQLKLAGVFYPIGATTATAIELYRGSVTNPTAIPVEIQRLTASYKFGPTTFAEFYYQASDRSALHRMVAFRDGLPVYVEDRRYLRAGTRLKLVSLRNPKPEHLEQLRQTRKDAIVTAQTRVQWSKLQGELSVPIKISSRTTQVSSAVEVAATCVWLVNDAVAAELFDPQTIGKLTPLQTLSGIR